MFVKIAVALRSSGLYDYFLKHMQLFLMRTQFVHFSIDSHVSTIDFLNACLLAIMVYRFEMFLRVFEEKKMEVTIIS